MNRILIAEDEAPIANLLRTALWVLDIAVTGRRTALQRLI